MMPLGHKKKIKEKNPAYSRMCGRINGGGGQKYAITSVKGLSKKHLWYDQKDGQYGGVEAGATGIWLDITWGWGVEGKLSGCKLPNASIRKGLRRCRIY